MCSTKIFIELLSCIFFLITVVAAERYGYKHTHLKEGDLCLDQKGDQGICVDYRRCPYYEFHILTSEREYSTCSFNDGIPIVCCMSCCQECYVYNMTYALEVEDKINKILGRTGVKHFDKCIQYYNTLNYPCKKYYQNPRNAIIDLQLPSKCYMYSYSAMSPAGGKDAERTEFPHMALLGYGEDLESAQWMCGGSLISEKYILTAAHCRSDPRIGPAKFVALGMLKRSDPINLWNIYNVSRFIPHPDYRPPNKYHDIALIELDKKVNFTESVLPACLAGNDNVNDYHVKSKETACATGWGALGHRSLTADVLQKVDLQEFSDLECAVQYPPGRHLCSGYNHTTQMCYGHKTMPRDTCSGDSGGPLQVGSRLLECLQVIIGVTSYGGVCGFAGSAGIYTRVSNYVPWIENIVWP